MINFENIALAESNVALFSPSSIGNSTTEYNSVFRSGTAFLVLLGTGMHYSWRILASLIFFILASIQYFFYIIFYQHLIADKIMNFVDLCSVSNISVFILNQNHRGYYIHGRSPHGITDVNMKDMIMNLERESRMMSGTRGLEANSTEQMFIIKVNRAFRIQYELLFRKFYVSAELS